MELGRCRRLVPVALLAVTGISVLAGVPLVAAAGAAASRAGSGPLPPCGAGGAPPGVVDAWFQLDPVLDRSGTLVAQRLVAGSGAGPTPVRSLRLAAESFASGPVAGRVIAGSDDGAHSVLRAVDPARGCATVIARVRDAVVRSAVASRDGGLLYEHRVDRVTRADLGIWRRRLVSWQASGPAQRVMAPLAADARYGPVFTTGLQLASDGSLVVSSCGLRSCRDRVLAPDRSVSEAGFTGPALGSVDGALISRAACPGVPCPVVAHDADGSDRVLVGAADGALLAGLGESVLVYEDGTGTVRTLDLRSGTAGTLGTPATRGMEPVPGGSLATSGASSSLGEVVLAPHGHVADPSDVLRITPASSDAASPGAASAGTAGIVDLVAAHASIAPAGQEVHP